MSNNNLWRTLKILVILGPTASGKSALAVHLARRFNGEVVSADSRQVYKGMNIGTGKITKKEAQGIKHHLLDIVSPKTIFDVARYQKKAHRAIADICARGKLPILCGGTGLYIKAIVENITYPDVKPDWKLRAWLEKKTSVQLFTMLTKLDPQRARTIDRHNPRRLIRALEITWESDSQVTVAQSASLYDALILGIIVPKEKLKQKIKKRLRERIKKGMIAEVKRLHKNGISWKRMAEIGLEYKYIALYLQGKMTKQEILETLATKIGQYAKRQMTWFRKTKNVRWINTHKKAERAVRAFLVS